MVTTTADERITAAKNAIRLAYENFGEVLINHNTKNMWGAEEYKREWLKSIFDKLDTIVSELD